MATSVGRSGADRGDGVDGGRAVPDGVHPALVRPVLHLGVERPVIALEATVCAALLFGVGPNPLTIACIAVLALVVHPVAVWLTARDEQAVELYLRSRSYADFYAPLAAAHVSHPRPRASVPVTR